MKHQNEKRCGCTETAERQEGRGNGAERTSLSCGTGSAIRTRFFQGMLLEADDLSVAEETERMQRQRIAGFAMGCGIVCGLDLAATGDKCCPPGFVVTAGLALDGEGRWINVRTDVRIPVASPCGCPGGCDCDGHDPTYSGTKRFCVWLRYDEQPTDPRGVKARSGCDCSSDCEKSRVREGWCIELVDEARCKGPACCDCAPGKKPGVPADAPASAGDAAAITGDAEKKIEAEATARATAAANTQAEKLNQEGKSQEEIESAKRQVFEVVFAHEKGMLLAEMKAAAAASAGAGGLKDTGAPAARPIRDLVELVCAGTKCPRCGECKGIGLGVIVVTYACGRAIGVTIEKPVNRPMAWTADRLNRLFRAVCAIACKLEPQAAAAAGEQEAVAGQSSLFALDQKWYVAKVNPKKVPAAEMQKVQMELWAKDQQIAELGSDLEKTRAELAELPSDGQPAAKKQAKVDELETKRNEAKKFRELLLEDHVRRLDAKPVT